MHRIVPGSVPDYYGMYSDDIGWGLVITDEKTFIGDSSKRDETYMYIYSLQSGKTGQAFVISTDFGRETIILSALILMLLEKVDTTFLSKWSFRNRA